MIRGKIIVPIYKREIREIPYCPTCKLKLEGSEKEYFCETQWRCNCGFWTQWYDRKIKNWRFKITKGYY